MAVGITAVHGSSIRVSATGPRFDWVRADEGQIESLLELQRRFHVAGPTRTVGHFLIHVLLRDDDLFGRAAQPKQSIG